MKTIAETTKITTVYPIYVWLGDEDVELVWVDAGLYMVEAWLYETTPLEV